MKTAKLLYILLILLLSSCVGNHHSYPQSLIVADSLANTNPKKAIALLKNIDSNIYNRSEAIQMYYRLLCIKANDKAYIQPTSHNPILDILHYYIKKNDKQHLPEAYYYAGRMYRDSGDAPQALDYFKKAIETLPKNERHTLRSNIYSQIGTLFAYQGLYAEALEFYKKSYQCNIVLKDSVGMVFNLRDIANMHRELERSDSALLYFKETNSLSLKLQQIDLFNMIQSQLAGLYIDLKEYDSAHVALQNALKDIEQPNKSGIYATAANFYYTTGNIDSAVWYYNELLDCGTVYAKRTAYRRLLELAINQQRNMKLISHYFSGYKLYIDSIQKLTQTETIHRMHSLYNYQLREKENMHLKAANQNKKFLLWIFVIGLLTVILVFIAYGQYSKRKNLKLEGQLNTLKKIEKENREKIELLEKYKSQKEELERSLANVAVPHNKVTQKRVEKKIELLNHILQQKEIESGQEKEAKEDLFNSDLYAQLHARANSVRGEAYITSEEWEMLKELISPAFPTFFTRLYSLHTPNENELHVCILLKIEFRPADIARLLQLKPESISSIRKRLYLKVTGNTGTPELWDKIIHSL